MAMLCDGKVAVYGKTYPRARKNHRCEACGLTIFPGERFIRLRIVFDGSAETIKRCGRCEKTHLHLRELMIDDDDWWPDERLACGEDYENLWGPIPEEIGALPFLTSQEASALVETLAGGKR